MTIKTTPSLFDSLHLARELAGTSAAFVIGFTGYQDCLAAAFDAQRHAVRLMFVSDAIASPAFSPYAPALSDALIGEMLGRLASATTTLELLQRETYALVYESQRLLLTTGGIMNHHNNNEMPTLDETAAFTQTALPVAADAGAPAEVIDHLLNALRALSEAQPPQPIPARA